MDPPLGRASLGNEPEPKLPADAASGMNGSRRQCRMAPVLPNVPDVEMDTCSGSLNLAEVLDKELRDPVWATDIEIRLRNAISAAEELELARVEVECRMTSCGILLVHAVGADNRRQQSVVSGLLSEAVAFQQWAGTAPIGATADGKVFSMIGLMRATGREQLWPAPPTISALPGEAGVEIPLTGFAAIDQGHPAQLLATETDNPEWSRPMESRVIAEVAASAPAGWYQSSVECRRTTCGVVLLYPPDTNVDVERVEGHVAEELGLRSGRGRSYQRQTGTLVTLYLHR
jgi:hypothetical protein